MLKGLTMLYNVRHRLATEGFQTPATVIRLEINRFCFVEHSYHRIWTQEQPVNYLAIDTITQAIHYVFAIVIEPRMDFIVRTYITFHLHIVFLYARS